MKKLFLLTITAGLAISSFAQNAPKHIGGVKYSTAKISLPENPLYKTTTVGAVDTLMHIDLSTDTLAVYLAGSTDSGFVSGMDPYGDKGFAERYDFNGADSTLQVIGLAYFFSGTVNPASTKTVSFKVWSEGAQTSASITGRPNIYFSGFPNTVLTSQSVAITNIGIGTTADTPKITMFTTPTAYLSASFFVGYDINYTWATAAGDTIGLFSNLDGERTEAAYTVSGTDTILNDVNATQYSDNTWHDNLFDNFGIDNNFFLFPLVKVGHGLSVQGVTNKNFTFFGNYPNPATTSTNIKFSLAGATDVFIQVTDMSGRVVNNITEKNMTAGEHIINMNTANLAAGDYVYVIRAAIGGGIGSKFSVIK